jgi:hypothetical protein
MYEKEQTKESNGTWKISGEQFLAPTYYGLNGLCEPIAVACARPHATQL